MIGVRNYVSLFQVVKMSSLPKNFVYEKNKFRLDIVMKNFEKKWKCIYKSCDVVLVTKETLNGCVVIRTEGKHAHNEENKKRRRNEDVEFGSSVKKNKSDLQSKYFIPTV